MKAPIRPGKILLEEWMEPFEISQTGLARCIGVPPRRINEIVLGKRAITADTAIRLAQVFATTPEYWMALQAKYEIGLAETAPERNFLLHTSGTSLEREDSYRRRPKS